MTGQSLAQGSNTTCIKPFDRQQSPRSQRRSSLLHTEAVGAIVKTSRNSSRQAWPVRGSDTSTKHMVNTEIRAPPRRAARRWNPRLAPALPQFLKCGSPEGSALAHWRISLAAYWNENRCDLSDKPRDRNGFVNAKRSQPIKSRKSPYREKQADACTEGRHQAEAQDKVTDRIDTTLNGWASSVCRALVTRFKRGFGMLGLKRRPWWALCLD